MEALARNCIEAEDTYLVLTAKQIEQSYLLSLIKKNFPGMKIITQHELPPEATRFFRIKPPGILARYTRQPGA